jgi:hypothetical protein
MFPNRTSDLELQRQLDKLASAIDDLTETLGLHTGPDHTSIEDPHPSLKAQLVYTKEGAPSDDDYVQPPADGTIVVDVTNDRIYVRTGGSWMYASLV